MLFRFPSSCQNSIVQVILATADTTTQLFGENNNNLGSIALIFFLYKACLKELEIKLRHC